MNNARSMLVVVMVALSSLAIVASARRFTRPASPTALGIEIALTKPFYVPAATGGKITTIVIRVPLAADADPLKEVSAIKLEPKMENGKVSVAVFALKGDANDIKTCKEWDALQATSVGTYVAGLDDEVSLTKLRDYGVNFGKDPLSFRVVVKRTLSPLPQDPMAGCGCGSCGGLICCPNSGHCLSCSSCGSVCCSNE